MLGKEILAIVELPLSKLQVSLAGGQLAGGTPVGAPAASGGEHLSHLANTSRQIGTRAGG